MKKTYILSILLFFAIGLFAQNTTADYWRDLGYKAKLKGDIESSIKNYKKVLEIDDEDFDAKLALANLFYSQKDFDEALNYYNLIYKVDKKDVEALNGFGRCYYKLGKLDKSTYYFQKAIENLPSYIQQYFDLAHVFIDKGELDSARIVYSYILKRDRTYAEAWAGIGKMYYWQNCPKTAVEYYVEAINLDPENKVIQKNFLQIKNELAYVPSVSLSYINESEDSYKINALVQKYRLKKRINDHFSFSINFLLDKSDRDYSDDIADTNRWFDNTWIKASWITKNNTLSAFLGASKSDSRLTSYGLNWITSFNISNIKFKNNLSFGYDYFYYWNNIGKDYISNSFSATYRKFSLNVSGMYGVIKEDTIADYYADKYEIDNNPHKGYGITLKYQLFKKPKVFVSIGHSYLDYDYKTPLYYTPYERILDGISFSAYYSLKGFYVYSDFAYNIGRESTGENSEFIDIDSWSANIEIGYSLKKISFSVGGSHFENPFYKTSNVSFTIKGMF